MPEIFVNHRPSPVELRKRIRHGLGRLAGGLQVVAEDVLGHVSRIDLIARDQQGAPVVVLIAGEAGDDGLLTRGLAQRAWLAPRVADWLKLSPDLGLEPGLPVRLLLIAPRFGPELIAAAESLGRDVVSLATVLYLQAEHQRSVHLESVPTADAPLPGPESELLSVPVRSPFRSGLDEDDLAAPAAAPSNGSGRY